MSSMRATSSDLGRSGVTLYRARMVSVASEPMDDASYDLNEEKSSSAKAWRRIIPSS